MIRLLTRKPGSDEFELVTFRTDDLPPYAILSHTWTEGQEVTYDELLAGTGKGKAGFAKIRFCEERAAHDGLQYFWVDTCCIDKSNRAELQEAIASMFRWYRRSAKCYVYLADVSIRASWEQAFGKSRWFTRGWTLQELLAPSTAEFFSQEGSWLGDKQSLEQQIHGITGLPISALQGESLSQFSVKQRLSWIEPRQTKLEEDLAYSLLGIFDVHLPLRYGEGKVNAFERLENEIYKLEKCIQDLHLTDPRDDKKRIEDTKGGLLKDLYRWILENSSFNKWRHAEQSRLLWIKGDPGKGKTMLLCGLIDELDKSIARTDLLAYFFCQATDLRINNATAVLRGLIYMLISQQPSLVSHIQKKYDRAGIRVFEDANAWVALSEIFTNIIQDPALSTTYLLIDALDECMVDLPKLLRFIAQQSNASLRVKWIISSRNWPEIEEQLQHAGHKIKLSLELNAKSISTAVDTYIQHKVLKLAQLKKYNDETRVAVLAYLSRNADNTFLWAALVCQNLEQIHPLDTLERLNEFPPGLDSLYSQMLQQLRCLYRADLGKRILAMMTVAYRPVTLYELKYLVDVPDHIADNLEAMIEIIRLCGSFLTIRDGAVSFVHQSAKDFLVRGAYDEIYPLGLGCIHHSMFVRSLQVMSRTLQRDIYGLCALGCSIEQIERPDPDPLVGLRYACVFWIDHLLDWWSKSCVDPCGDLQDGGKVEVFIKEKYLYWLEALALCKSLSEGVVSIGRLEALLQARDAPELLKLVHDARRFILYHRVAIENSPLQAYASALMFSPARSLIKKHFKHEEPNWIATWPAVGDEWSACLATFEGHGGDITSVVFSNDGTRLASASADRTVKIWDAGSGACLQTLEGHHGDVLSVAFSHDGTRLASESYGTVKIWDAGSGACLQTLVGHGKFVTFSHYGIRLASADFVVKIWDTGSGACLQMLGYPGSFAKLIASSHNGTRLASASWETVKIWDTGSGACLATLESHCSSVKSGAFSYDGTRIALASYDHIIRLWDAGSGACLQTLEGHCSSVNSVTLSHDGTRLASASHDYTVKIWDAGSGACLQTLEGHRSSVRSVAFSHDGTRLASASLDQTVRVWDVGSVGCMQTLEGHCGYVRWVAFSHDGTRLASTSLDQTVKIWDTGSGACLQTLHVDKQLFKISFDTTGRYLHTDIGTIAVDASSVPNAGQDAIRHHFPQSQGAGLSSNGHWIIYNLEPLIWLPSEYRPMSSAVSGRTIGVGVGNGKVWVCSFQT